VPVALKARFGPIKDQAPRARSLEGLVRGRPRFNNQSVYNALMAPHVDDSTGIGIGVKVTTSLGLKFALDESSLWKSPPVGGIPR